MAITSTIAGTYYYQLMLSIIPAVASTRVLQESCEEVRKLHKANPLLNPQSVTNSKPAESSSRTLKCDQCEFVAVSVRRLESMFVCLFMFHCVSVEWPASYCTIVICFVFVLYI